MPDAPILITVSPDSARVWHTFTPLVCALLPFSENSFSCSVPSEELIQCLIAGRELQLICPEPDDWPDTEPTQSPLAPKSPLPGTKSQRRWIAELTSAQLLGDVRSSTDAVAFLAGLSQLHDDLDASHQASQSIEGRGKHRAGDYWHAIMHRREPDYANSKYWFRHVGEHPIFPTLGQYCAQLASQSSDPQITDWSNRLQQGRHGWHALTFVDLCQTAATGPDPLRSFAERLQRREMWLLLASTQTDALS